MTTYNTGNPLGSKDPRDLYDNAENLDTAVNDPSRDTWTDRLGRSRKTMSGMEREFNADQESRVNRFNTFIASSGYQFLGDYASGIEITEYNQIVRDADGEFWRLSGQVELPYTTTGAGVPEDDALVPAGDAVLRQDLANPDKGAGMVGLMQGGTVADAVKYVTPQMCGMDWDLFAAAPYVDKHIPSGHYKLNKSIVFEGDVSLTYGDVLLDFSEATGPTGREAVKFDAGAITALPPLGLKINKGDFLITFASEHGLKVGDVFCVYNEADFSFSLWRDYYRAGEFFKVTRVVNPTSVLISGFAFDSYEPHDVIVRKLPGKSCSTSGGALRILSNDAGHTGIGFYRYSAVRTKDIISSNSPEIGIVYNNCFDVSGQSLSTEQMIRSESASSKYGIKVNSCQRVVLEGNFTAHKHAADTGIAHEGLTFPSRDIHFRGSFSNNYTEENSIAYKCASVHANTEYFSFDGNFYGGINISGDYGEYRGTCYVTEAGAGVAAYASELVGWSHDFSSLTIVSTGGDPNAINRGTIDIGGSSDATSKTKRGGILDLSGLNIIAPESNRIVRISQRNTTEFPIDIKLDGTIVHACADDITQAIRIYTYAPESANFRSIDVGGFQVIGHKPIWYLMGIDKIYGWQDSGLVSLTIPQGESNASTAVEFHSQAPTSTPHVLTQVEGSAFSGTKLIVPLVLTPSRTGFTLRAETIDRSSVSSDISLSIAWTASYNQ